MNTNSKYEEQRRAFYERDHGICGVCGEHVEYEEMNIDHIIPKRWGGPNDSANLQVTHEHCNDKKLDRCSDDIRASFNADQSARLAKFQPIMGFAGIVPLRYVRTNTDDVAVLVEGGQVL